MSFDLYFAGAKNSVVEDYLIKQNAYRLQSQFIDRKNIDYWITHKTNQNKLFIDSGAYTAYTKGVAIDTDEYISYLNKFTEEVTIFAQLDTIPGRFNQPKTVEQIKEAPALSWKNYLYMTERLKEPQKLIPIFHQGENFYWLQNMLEYTDKNNKPIDYIGISPATDVKGLKKFLDTSFSIIAKSSNPNIKTHAFGMTQLKLLEIYPYYSADSTSWKLCAAMGNIYTPWGTVYISNRQSKYGFRNQPLEAQEKVCEYVTSIGYDFKEAQTHDYIRYKINIDYLLDWARNFKRTQKFHIKPKLF